MRFLAVRGNPNLATPAKHATRARDIGPRPRATRPGARHTHRDLSVLYNGL